MAPEVRALVSELRATAETVDERVVVQLWRQVQAEARAASAPGARGVIAPLTGAEIQAAEATVRDRAARLGIPEDDLYHTDDRRTPASLRAFNPFEAAIGGSGPRGISVDVGVFDDAHPHFARHQDLADAWRHLIREDRIDTTLVHEYFEKQFQVREHARWVADQSGQIPPPNLLTEHGIARDPRITDPGHQWALHQAAGAPGQFPGLSQAARDFLNLRRQHMH
jgi:hypothetical protein